MDSETDRVKLTSDSELARLGVFLADAMHKHYTGQSAPSAPAPAPSPSTPPTPAKLAVDGYWGPLTSKEVQGRLGVNVDGYMGPVSVKALQSKLGTIVDGVVSGQTRDIRDKYLVGWVEEAIGIESDGVSAVVRKLQTTLGVTVDGFCGPKTIAALQRRLNDDPGFLL
jgi:peptidoglycan hydrolase-like protein with peptidoglycan-binding domain